MNDRIEWATRVGTSVSLVACVLLLGPGFAGVSSSLALAAVALLLGGLTFAYRDRLGTLSDMPWLRTHLRVAWAGPLVAALVFAAFSDATPKELQTLGAVVGLIGMFNYLLRPLYFFLGELLARLNRAL
jgi:drug/metabolite transporter (DMT)-like permease